MTNQPNNQPASQNANQKQGNNQPSNQPNQGSRADQPTPVSPVTQGQGQQQGQAPSGDLKQMGREMASDAKNAVTHAASNATSQVKEQVSDLTQNVQEQATSYLGEQKGMAADRLDGVASALRNVGQEFNEHDEGTLAHYTDGLAEQIERFSGSLRDREIGSLVEDARQLAHRQPEWFVAGALAVGFALGRFFKSSQRSRYDDRGYDDRGYGNPSDYTEGFSSNYPRGYTGGDPRGNVGGYPSGYTGGYYEGGTTSDYARGAYRNPEGYSQGASNPNANPYGNTYEAQVRGEVGAQPDFQGSRDYDAGYRAGSQPEYRGSTQSTGQPTTHGLGTGQSVQREEELGIPPTFDQDETLTANKATQNEKSQRPGQGQGDYNDGARR